MAVMTKDEYIESLRKLNPTVYMFGEKVENVVDNPRLRAGIEATGATYEVANMEETRHLAVTKSPLIDEEVNRFTLPPASISDLVARVKLNRNLGTWVGTCHQRCTGLDCLSTLSMTTYDIDQKYGTNYNKNFIEFLKYVQKNDLACNAGVTDMKGDRRLAPSAQKDPDMYLHVVEKRDDGIVVRGAKAHQTGSLSSHEIIVLPTRAMRKGDEDYAVAFAVPQDTPGLIHVVGRSTLDMRELEGCDIGNQYYSKYCPTLIFNDVFVPWERVFQCGEVEFAADNVIKFSSFHRQSHGGCKGGQDRLYDRRLSLHDGIQRHPESRPSQTKSHRHDSPGRNLVRMLLGIFLRGKQAALWHLFYRYGTGQCLQDSRGQRVGRIHSSHGGYQRRLCGRPSFGSGSGQFRKWANC